MKKQGLIDNWCIFKIKSDKLSINVGSYDPNLIILMANLTNLFF